MSEESTNNQPEKTDVEDVAEGIDGILYMLVKQANEVGYGFGLTLSVGGTIISGITMGRGEFREAFMSTMAAGFEAGGNSEMAESLRGVYAEGGRDPEDEEGVKDVIEFIHLKDARLFHPGQVSIPPPSAPGVVWRVKLTAVDAFSLGILSSEVS